MEAEGCLLRRGQPAPIRQGGVQQDEGADQIGLDEGRWPVDGTVHMGFRGQMHDRIRPVTVENRGDGPGVADVGPLEAIARVRFDGGKRPWDSRVCQLIQIDHMDIRFRDQEPDDSGTDKAGAARDKQFHRSGAFCRAMEQVSLRNASRRWRAIGK